MKHFTLKSTIVAISLLSAVSANAQYITEAPAGGFDFSKGKDYVILYAPDDIITNIESMGKMKSNQTLDPTQTKNALYYWVADWDKKLTSLCNVPHDGQKNSFGSDSYQCMTPSGCWGGSGTAAFTPLSTPYDFSMIDNDYILHIGATNCGNNDATLKLTVGSSATINDNGFQLTMGKPVGTDDGNSVGVGSLPLDSKWYHLEIPIADLVDPAGVFGFSYNFSTPITDAAITIGMSGTASTTTHKLDKPTDKVYTYTITKLGSAVGFDSFFFYKKDNSSSGINEIRNTDNEIQAVYDLSGRRTDMSRPGIYVVKTANGVKKVAVK